MSRDVVLAPARNDTVPIQEVSGLFTVEGVAGVGAVGVAMAG